MRCVWLLLAGWMVMGAAWVPTSLQTVRDGRFTLTMSGRVSSSMPQGTDAQGHRLVEVAISIVPASGSYPAVQLNLDLAETLTPQGAGSLTGTATLADSTGQTPLFAAMTTGTLDATGLARYTLSQVHTTTGTGGSLTWQGALRTDRYGAVNATAQGQLVLPGELPPALTSAIWPGAPMASGPPGAVDPTLWYLTRAAGLTAYVLLVMTTALGIGISTRAFDSMSQRRRVLDLHQLLTLLLVAFIGLHLLTLVLDPFLPYGIVPLFLPLAQPYRPLPAALGVLSLYGTAVVTVSSWIRQRLSYRTWHRLHYVAAPALLLGTLHGILAGTDTPLPLILGLYVTGSLLIGALTLLRLGQALANWRIGRTAATRKAGTPGLSRNQASAPGST